MKGVQIWDSLSYKVQDVPIWGIKFNYLDPTTISILKHNTNMKWSKITLITVNFGQE